ncbi:MAG: hypothetical protein U0P45_13610 [Acidimicrobiales bacterium]
MNERPALPRWAPLAWAPFAIGVVHWFGYTPDDAFITIHHAANLVAGHGPVLQPGVRVEGATSPAHLVLAALVHPLAGGHQALGVKLASVVAAALALWRGADLADEVLEATWARLLARAALAASWALVVAAVSGMETSLAILATTELLLRLVRGDEADRPVAAGLLAAATVLVRPDAALLVAAVALPGARRAVATRSTTPVRWLAVAALPLVAVEALRRWWFGAWLPNTYWAKRGPLGSSIAAGWDYVADVAGRGSGLHPQAAGTALATVIAAATGAALVAGAWRAARRPGLAVLPLALGAQVAVALFAGGDRNQGGRFVAPVVAAAVALVVLALESAVDRAAAARPSLGRPAAACAIALVAAATAFTWHTRPAPAWPTGRDPLGDHALVAATGEVWADAPAMLGCAAPGWTVAWTEMGYGPWARRDLRYLDLRGLVDRPIATGAPRRDHDASGVRDPEWSGGEGFVVRQLLARRPEVLITNGPPVTSGPVARAYVPVRTWRFRRSPTSTQEQATVHVRRDLTDQVRCPAR